MQPVPSLVEMGRLITGFSVTAAIFAVAELRIADQLSDGPRRAADLAHSSGVDEDFLRRVLRYLASEGVFEERAGDLFALTERSYWLRSDVVGSLLPRALYTGSRMSWTAWGNLLQCMRTGASAFHVAFGEGLFDYVRHHPHAGATFNAFMAAQTAASVDALLAAYSFAGVRELADVGGGRGALLAGVLRANPGARGSLFDLPEVVATAQPLLDQAGVADRCRVIGGDFFDFVPAGADVYALKFILHDWPDDKCIRILRNCRQAMTPGGKVVIVEHIVPDDGGPHFSRFMDINMMVNTSGGRERTRAEFERLLAAADLQLRHLAHTPIALCVLECTAP